jgi:hypothetical protein
MHTTKCRGPHVKLREKDEKYQRAIKRKLEAYHFPIQVGLIAQGLLQYSSSIHSEIIWNSFGSWLLTIRTIFRLRKWWQAWPCETCRLDFSWVTLITPS